ncbi:hypothetical protein BGLT_00402 [Caballeronia glathei]|nr:hypothetical protein [Caballeronia glathei]CDY75857.1 hypothetical protein BGLT_00402 [Caballeronia glathei]
MSVSKPYRSITKRSSWILCFQFNQGASEGRWKTQSEAAKHLGVSCSDLSRALKIETLPEEILNLHESPTAITSHTIRMYQNAIAKDGLATVLSRVRQYPADTPKLSNRVVVSIVTGRMSASQLALKTAPRRSTITNESLPVDLATTYHEGILSGKWTSKSGGAQALNVSARTLREAIAIRDLPMDVRFLISTAPLTFKLGRKILRLAEEIGHQELHARAKKVEPTSAIRTAANVLDELERKHIKAMRYTDVKVRRGRGNKHLIIACEDAKFLLKYRREIESAIRKVLEKRIKDARMEAIKQIIAKTGVKGLNPETIEKYLLNWLLERDGYDWLVDVETT